VALAGEQVDAPVSTASLPFGASGVVGPGYPWDGAKRATYEEATHQPKHLTAREGAAGQFSSQRVEGAVGSFFAHLCPLFPKGGLIRPAVLYNASKYEGLQGLAQLRRIPKRRSSQKPSRKEDE
jgi:hypothetical protein